MRSDMHRRVHDLQRKELLIGQLFFLYNAHSQGVLDPPQDSLAHDHPVEFGDTGLMADALDIHLMHLKRLFVNG